MNEDYSRSYFKTHTAAGGAYVADEAYTRKHKERMNAVRALPASDASAPNDASAPAASRPLDTVSFFALAFVAATLLYWLPLKGSSFETAFTYAVGAGVLGAAVGALVVAASRFLGSARD